MNYVLFYFRFFIFAQLICSPNTFAFTSSEHKRIGDNAFKIALSIMEIKCVSTNDTHVDSEEEICELLDRRQNTHESYGDIVRNVDFMLSTDVILWQIGDSIDLPKNHHELNPFVTGKQSKGTQKSRKIRATHNNDAHFQAGLHYTLHELHNRAIQIAENGDSLFAALIYNALSDHFLHDYFAPGHILTPRVGTHDALAGGLHDLGNARGAKFNIKNWDKLESILEYVTNSATLSRSLKDILVASPQLLQNIPEIYLFGDGSLSRNIKQELLMTLVNVHSIIEILSCYKIKNKCKVARDKKYTFIPVQVEMNDDKYFPNLEPTLPVQSEIFYGKYDFDIEYSEDNDINLAIGVSLEQTNVLNYSADYRYGGIFELTTLGSQSAVSKIYRGTSVPVTNSAYNIGSSTGIVWVEGANFSGQGWSYRLFVSNPSLDVQFGIYFRWMDIKSDNVEFEYDKPTYGLRADIGFSFLTAYASLGNNYIFEDQSLDRDISLSLGVSFVVPLVSVHSSVSESAMRLRRFFYSN